MKKQGLELVKYRTSEPEEFKILNGLFSKELPISFSLFLRHYYLEPESFTNAHRNFEEISIPITSVYYANKNIKIRLSHFYNISSLISRWTEDIEYSDLYKRYDLLPIAYTEINLDHILIKLDDNGSIWYLSSEEKPIFLEENIFSFFKNVFESEVQDRAFLNKKIHKNWGEDFWRVREKSDL